MGLLWLLLLFHSFCHGRRDRLLFACHLADVAQVRYLLSEYEAGILHAGTVPVIIDRKEPDHGRTSLLQCGFDPQSDDLEELDQNCTSIAHMLSLHGANLSHVDKHGWNGVSIGAMKGMTKYTEFLLSRGVPIDLADSDGRTPLMKATVHGHLSTIKMLLERGANISRQDNFGWSVLHFATRQVGGHDFYLPIFNYLVSAVAINASSALNLRDSDGRTPLMYAAVQGTGSAIYSLVQSGADPTLEDHGGMTAYQITSDDSLKRTLALASAEWVMKAHSEWKQQIEREMGSLENEDFNL
jgi:ankyrin repeat protein